jgi:FkbM family methyltransferase
MSLKDRIRRQFRRLGYSIYRSTSLPVGLDLVADVSRIKDFASMRVVFDVGANVGDWTQDYLALAPMATFYCFEPSAGTFQALSRRIGTHPRVRTVRTAAGSATTTTRLHKVGSSVQYSLKAPTQGGEEVETEEVQVLTLDDFADAQRITHLDFLKVDTEGYDAEVLAGADRLLSRQMVDFVFVEVNFAQGDVTHTHFDAIAAPLGRHGYQPIGFYDVHLWGPPWFVMYMNVLFTRL